MRTYGLTLTLTLTLGSKLEADADLRKEQMILAEDPLPIPLSLFS